MSKILICLLFLMTAIISGCESPVFVGQLDGAVDAKRIRAHLKLLSDDVMGGRAPGSPGGELAAKYIASQFEEAGLHPAVGDTSYFQDVELIGIKNTAALNVNGYDQFWGLVSGRDFVAWTFVDQPFVSLRNKQLVFAGYGIEAPEFNWSDYTGVDVNGKVVLVLVNEPRSTSKAFFEGSALTYYGRWTYKFEEAIRQGAEGVILIHTPALAGYGWNVVENSRTREIFHVKPAANQPLLSLQAWISEEKANEMFAAAGFNFTDLISEAGTSAFKPRELDLRVSAVIRNQSRVIHAQNVIAKLKGIDPLFEDEFVLYTSHYDHLGTVETDDPDGIFNGALDNASGTATLLEIARGFSQSQLRTKRSILFAAVTAEESGLLGSKFYTEHPVVPLENTIANINIDVVNVWEATRDIVALGSERSTLKDVIQTVASEMNLSVSPDPTPEAGIFFRSDQFSFVKKGVPSVFLKGGTLYPDRPADWGQKLWSDYRANRYHTVADEYDDAWSLAGAAQLAQVALKTGFYLGNELEIPQWREGEQFKR